ncbi:MAG: FKBP-type peptidyl-prolyl cis-trans isomerase [Candidatus Bathyarchaeota archaeon]|jgi:peptidylprolyl isomerase|nr:FKBP-type peptidyl-prolyl cis-trans isomerase [Candidatus Bathyarchaeota archaeon]MDD4325074.1 FKBP-type peptidyl-prolyl cis-trans isomerase [Candidatus Bathyarchaeota archaeon]MDI9577226.1 FKBP-type peptidyl-prolyl cis-trans isomerase [Thermoproteota archaeon]MDT8782369.1 peptidylprolyl isomerase [Candidatus Bathyarchaeota archaeon]NLD65325.1 peptidylprolyl isomerase [Thermoproteota archaeon]
MVLQKGDFILIDYVAKVKETNEVFDTTNEDVAKKERLHKEGEIHEPKLVVVGESWVLKALDDSLLTAEVGKPANVEIPADKAFGPRDPEKIRRVPVKQLYAKEINPIVGARIEYQGKMATIRSVGAGRVLLDFNPPLAGRTLIYDLTVTQKLNKAEEKIVALIHRRIPVVEENKFKITIKAKNLSIDMPEETFYVEGVQIAKRGIAMDIQKFLPDLIEIKFVETFKSEPKPETPAPAVVPSEEKKAEKKPAKETKPAEQ